MKQIFVFAIFSLSIIAIQGCKKTEGRGGSNSIAGNVVYEYYDHNDELVYTEKAIDEDVYIIYGEEQVYNDDVSTDFNGNYIFRYLHPGNYTLFAYGDCDTCSSELEKKEIKIEIKGNKNEIEAPQLSLRQNIDPDDGTASVTGSIYVEQYNVSNQLIAEYDGAEERVYIIYGNDSTHFDDVRTNENGMYLFDDLIQGTYTIYAYSDCVNCGPSGTEAKKTTITISEKGEAITAAQIVIEKRP